MIISHSHKFIFIHVYKVAGTSIINALRKYSYTPSKINRLKSFFGIYPAIYSSDFSDHIKAIELKRNIGDLYSKYYKFAFVRNPWDWQISLYYFAKQLETHHQHHLIRKMSFEEYLEWRVNEDFHLQKEFICDEDGKVIVDFIGKIETLQHDFNTLCSNLSIPELKLEKKNESKHKNYREYYTSKSIEIIAKAYQEDIDLFNYSF